MSATNLEELVKIYLTIRGERERILHDYEALDKGLKEEMALIEQSMLSICNDTNADSIKTQNGTVIRRMSERFYCSDWTNFSDFVLQNQAVELLERRIHQGNFKEFMAEHANEGLPPGVNVMKELGITVRKPTSH
jgi:hypothetical protein